jgi:hypothetical protein
MALELDANPTIDPSLALTSFLPGFRGSLAIDEAVWQQLPHAWHDFVGRRGSVPKYLRDYAAKGSSLACRRRKPPKYHKRKLAFLSNTNVGDL